MKTNILMGLLLWTTMAFSQTNRISFKPSATYPEGAAFDSRSNTFYVSSVTTGTIGTVDAAGQYRVFYEDRELKSSYGMKTDTARNLLWICTGDANYSIYSDPATYRKRIRLIALDLKTGLKTRDIDLSDLYKGPHFANDLVLDEKGNLYITDSYSPVIYRVDAQGKATVWAEHDLFKGEDVALNGIAYDPKGFLLVNNGSSGALLKVDIRDPKQVHTVKINNLFPGADGLLWDKAGQLVLIQNKGVDKIYQLASNDGWQTAQVKAATVVTDRFQYPSTGVGRNGKLYALNAKLNDLTDPTRKPSDEFSLQEVVFRPL